MLQEDLVGFAAVCPLPEPLLSVTMSPLALPLSYIDVYMDDFPNIAQGNHHRLCMVRHILMHTIDEAFQLPSASEATLYKEPISVKKMLQGDASWETTKVVLGWLIDTIRQTIQLPSHHLERLCVIFADLRHARRVSLSKLPSRVAEAFSAFSRQASTMPTVIGFALTVTCMPSWMI